MTGGCLWTDQRVLHRLLAAATAGACIPSAALAQSIVWMQAPPGGPQVRFGAGMTFDAARGVMVLFGGYDSNYVQLADTWTWSGTGVGAGGTWTQQMVPGPSARVSAKMAFDSARGVVVLFGGYTPPGMRNGETWEWNGAAWTQPPVSGPTPRDGHALAYDAARGVTVLFGGYAAPDSAETWEWNGTAWAQRAVPGPSARNGHALAYDQARGVMVLFGGQHLSSIYGDTWEWNGAGAGAWTQRVVAGPTARYGHSLAHDPARSTTVLFGGYTGTAFSDETWEWDGAAGMWAQRATPGPTPRYYHAMAFDSAHGSTVLFGGFGGAFTNDTWALACFANCDGSTAAPALNVADFTCFLQQYAAGNPSTNCDGSTAPPILNVADFTCFLQKYASGCP